MAPTNPRDKQEKSWLAQQPLPAPDDPQEKQRRYQQVVNENMGDVFGMCIGISLGVSMFVLMMLFMFAGKWALVAIAYIAMLVFAGLARSHATDLADAADALGVGPNSGRGDD